MIGLGALVRRAAPVPAAVDEPARQAIIDIGSNSLRLVVWAGPARLPRVILNEKVSASLGRTLSQDGLLPKKAMKVALRGLRRFALLVRVMEVGSLRVVATAAVREASNGAAFLDQVRTLGLEPETLSGKAEAEASGWGVLSAFPDGDGIVGDLGGGSLELVDIGKGRVLRGASFPWGTLRLPALRAGSQSGLARAIAAPLDADRWGRAAEGRTLYLVGGSWRALTHFAMQEAGFPLDDPHGFAMSPHTAAELAATLAKGAADRLQAIPHIPGSRIASQPDAAALLAALVDRLQPRLIVTSGFGLREGLLHAALDEPTRALDPLFVGLRDRFGNGPASAEDGDRLAAWIAPLFSDDGASDARVRHAACLLATLVETAGREARAQRSLELALHERWIGLEAAGRAMIAAALLAEAGERVLPDQLQQLCDTVRLARAARWGEAMRLARKLTGGVGALLACSELLIEGAGLVLRLDPACEPLYGDGVEQQHRQLAERMGLEPVLRVSGKV